MVVIPAPKLHEAPLKKFDPPMTTLASEAPCAPVLGLTLETPGGVVTAVVTVNAFGKVAICPSESVTVTVRVPVAALAAMVRFAVNCEVES